MSKQKIRKVLRESQHQQCFYCGISLLEEEENIDHIIPRFSGGTDDIENLALCCKSCNSTKGVKTLEEFRFAMRLKNSILWRIISCPQAAELERLGVLLPMASTHVFHFEQAGV